MSCFSNKRIVNRKIIILLLISISVLFTGCFSNHNLDSWAEKYGFEGAEVFPIQIKKYGFPYVEAKINNKEITMMFDTGNMVGMEISPEIAAKLNLSQIDKWYSLDSAGNRRGTFSIFKAEELNLFGQQYENLKVYESRINEFEGIISPYILKNKRFTLDYKNKVIGISDSSLPELRVNKEVFSLVSSPDYKTMPVIKGTVNGKEVLIQLDTGKSRTCVDKRLVNELNLPSSGRGCKVENIKLGSFEFSVANAKVKSFKGISKGYPEPIMLGLGSDIISKFVLSVDYGAEKVIISK